MNREELRAKYEQPVQIEDLAPGRIFCFEHESHEAARAYADANNEHYGYPAWVERRYEQWVSVVDVTSAIEEIERLAKVGW